MWECDGCGFTHEDEDVVNRHVLDNAVMPNGRLKPPEVVRCWGAMKVGGEAWIAYHIYGKHPMDEVLRMVREAYEL